MTETPPSTIRPKTRVASGGFAYDAGALTCQGLSVRDVVEGTGSPCYVYDAEGIRERLGEIRSALSPVRAEVCFAVKACPNLGVLRTLVEGGSGMDVVTVGELERAWLAGVPMPKVTFAGVAKGEHEIRAALDGSHSPLAGEPARSLCGRDPATRGPIGLFNCESAEELETIARVAREVGVEAPVAIRVNPGVTAGANNKVRVGATGSKFGVTPAEALDLAERARGLSGVRFRGLHLHLGSQIDSMECFDEAFDVIARLMDAIEARGIPVEVFDAGGGIAVSYLGEPAPTDADWCASLRRAFGRRVRDGMKLIVEPGREIVAQAGVLVTRVRRVKRSGGRVIVVCDAGLNALVRPAMYGAQHMIWPVNAPISLDPIAPPDSDAGLERVDVVGPVCESSDIFARDWAMPPVREGDLLAVFTAGAYGMSMAMTFNDLPLPAEILIDEGRATVVRAHQTFADLMAPTAHALRAMDEAPQQAGPR
ncbi:MAG: diaminopimelate decarboxylase [Phycisphaerales bacterium]